MEVISDNYLGTKRTVGARFYAGDEPFVTLTIREEFLSTLKIRFNPDKPEDLLFFDQLRAAIDKSAKFMRP